MNSIGNGRTSRRRRLASVAIASALVIGVAGTAVAGLVSGSLPASAFTFTSRSINSVDIGGNDIKLKTRGQVDVKTTYSRLAPTGALTGWHHHNGPVIVTVAVGTLTFVDGQCHTWDLGAGQSYLESDGQVLNAFLDPAKNAGLTYVEWFTTRLYPAGTADPVAVAAPCSL